MRLLHFILQYLNWFEITNVITSKMCAKVQQTYVEMARRNVHQSFALNVSTSHSGILYKRLISMSGHSFACNWCQEKCANVPGDAVIFFFMHGMRKKVLEGNFSNSLRYSVPILCRVKLFFKLVTFSTYYHTETCQ